MGPKAYFIESLPFEYTGDALKYIESRLAASAAGDGLASYEIHLRASSCKRAAAMPDQRVFDGYARTGLGVDYLEAMAKELDDCVSYLTAPTMHPKNWLENAADQGLVEAQLMYAQNPREALGEYGELIADAELTLAYRSKAMGHLHAALESGSLDALEMIGDIYARGILAPRNNAQAYAYKLALQQVDARGSRASELVELRRDLSANQIEILERQAGELIKRCCN